MSEVERESAAEVENESGWYDGPATVSRFRFGDREVAVARPADPERLLDHPSVLERNAADDYMPYWAWLWPGAFLLAEAVASRHWVSGTEAIEIGCGLGLAGLTAGALGLRVKFTDYDPEPLRFVSRSALESGIGDSEFSVGLLDWRRLPDERYPVILGADILYERRLVPLVADVIGRMLTSDGYALVAGPYRTATLDLETCLAERGLRAQAFPIASAGERPGETHRGTLHQIWRG